jgi:hypothetical protein
MKRSGLPVLMVMLLILLRIDRVPACPSCNIHNYLASSVRSATHIFWGEVLRQIDDKTAEAEVLKVLVGNHKVGSVVKIEMYGAKEYVGKRFIFSNPCSHPPTFPVLPVELEDEVLLLSQSQGSDKAHFLGDRLPPIKKMPEAIKRVQGISRETQQSGMDYIAKHHNEAVAPLIAELEVRMQEVFSTHGALFGIYRLRNLSESLLLKPSDAGQKFVLKQIGALLARNTGDVNWIAIPHQPSSQGVFLKDLLCHSRKHQILWESVDKLLQEAYPRLSGVVFAETTYALLIADEQSSDAVFAKISDSNREMFAVGLFLVANERSSEWQHERADALWEKALSLANRKEMKEAIARRIESAQRFTKRPNRSVNSNALNSPK